jgi:hypothetical protein
VTDPFAQMTSQLQQITGRTALMSAAYIGLALMERAGTALVELGPEENLPAYETAVQEAVNAARALSSAPSLASQGLSSPTVDAADAAFHAQLLTLALAVHQTLVAAATHVLNEADRVACLEAALHTGRVHQALS